MGGGEYSKDGLDRREAAVGTGLGSVAVTVGVSE